MSGRLSGLVVVITVWWAVAPGSLGAAPADAPVVAAPAADPVREALAAHVGKTLDVVELGTGRRIVRPRLEGLGEREGRVQTIRLLEEGRTTPTTVQVRGITEVVVGRETVYEAEAKLGGAAAARGRMARERRVADLAAAHERMRARGVEPWPELTAAEHAAEVEALKAFVEEVRAVFPRLTVAETHEFIFVTDIAAAEIAPYVKSLDSMHDVLCDLYGIPRGEPVWKGKCLVVAFRDEGDFQAFEARFMRADIPRGVHGLCHQSSTGRVVMACHRGDDADAFAHMLVHETSHGFNHRWLSPQRIPNWLNEGLAEWVGTQVVPRSLQVPAKEAEARAFMQQTRSLGPGFLTAANIQPVQYGIASQLVRFLVVRDRKKFAEFVAGIKEGMTAEESLEAAFKGSLADLIAAFGNGIGVPNLAP